jgi:hypothetical protein
MFITGCHRSGTSLLAALGAQTLVQQRRDDLAPLVDNPRGYFESERLRNCNDALLRDLGWAWHQPPLHPLDWQQGKRLARLVELRQRFADWTTSEDWLDKDPRLCITIGAFEHILLCRPPLAVSLREPSEVAMSLFKRDGISPERGLLIWWLYNRSLSIQLRAHDAVLIYQEVLDWRLGPCEDNASLQALWSWLRNNLNNHDRLGTSMEEFRQSSLNRIDPGLKRSKANYAMNSEIGMELWQLCHEAYLHVVHTNGDDRWKSLRAAFDTIPGWVANAYERILWEGEPDLEYIRNQTKSCESAAIKISDKNVGNWMKQILCKPSRLLRSWVGQWE